MSVFYFIFCPLHSHFPFNQRRCVRIPLRYIYLCIFSDSVLVLCARFPSCHISRDNQGVYVSAGRLDGASVCPSDSCCVWLEHPHRPKFVFLAKLWFSNKKVFLSDLPSWLDWSVSECLAQLSLWFVPSCWLGKQTTQGKTWLNKSVHYKEMCFQIWVELWILHNFYYPLSHSKEGSVLLFLKRQSVILSPPLHESLWVASKLLDRSSCSRLRSLCRPRTQLVPQDETRLRHGISTWPSLPESQSAVLLWDIRSRTDGNCWTCFATSKALKSIHI